MKTILLSLRNLLRNRRRSQATLLAMTIGLAATLVFGGYSRNSIYALQTAYVQLHGHLQIQRQDYFLYGGGNPATYGISDYQAIIDLVRSDPVIGPMLTVVTPKLELGGVMGNYVAGLSTNVLSGGIISDEQNQLRQWDPYGSASYSPKFALAGTPTDSVLIGQGVARKLQLCEELEVEKCRERVVSQASEAPSEMPADIALLSETETRPVENTNGVHVEMLAASVNGAPNVARLTVVEAQNWGLKEIDDTFTVMHLAQAQRLIFGAAPGEVTAIQIQLKHTHMMASAQARLNELLTTTLNAQPLEIIDYETLAPIYGQSIQFFNSVFGFIATLIGVIVLFTVGNTMSMAVVERTTEVGTLRALGQRRAGIRRMFVTEGTLLGIAGAITGVLAALGIAALINRSGLTWTPPGYVYAYPIKVQIWGDWLMIFGCALSLIAVAIVSAWWPARRASKLVVVDALRHI